MGLDSKHWMEFQGEGKTRLGEEWRGISQPTFGGFGLVWFGSQHHDRSIAMIKVSLLGCIVIGKVIYMCKYYCVTRRCAVGVVRHRVGAVMEYTS